MTIGAVLFDDRVQAGRRLAEVVERLALEDPVVLALPRGGVPVAAEVAARLGAPLDALVARKVGYPLQPELALGAVAEHGAVFVNDELVSALGLAPDDVDSIVIRQRALLQADVTRYAGDRRRPPMTGRTAVIVDDGLATGATARAAVEAVRAAGAARVVVAVPVAAVTSVAELRAVAEVVALATPEPFYAVGAHYRDFGQVGDETVADILVEMAAASSGPPAVGVPGAEYLFAGFRVSDLARAVACWSSVLGAEPASRPNPHEAVWHLHRAASLYVVAGGRGAGGGRALVVVEDLQARLDDLAARQVLPDRLEELDAGRKAVFADEDGNELAFAELRPLAESG